jgi:uncharacterized protein (DUF2344 family)
MIKSQRLFLYAIIYTMLFIISLFWLTTRIVNMPTTKSSIKIIKQNSKVSKCKQFDMNKHLLVFLKIPKTGTLKLTQQIQKNFSYRNDSKSTKWKKGCHQSLNRSHEYDCFKPSRQNDKLDQWFFNFNHHIYERSNIKIHSSYNKLIKILNDESILLDLTSRGNKIFYFTRIRNPIDRYISEWQFYVQDQRWELVINSDLYCKESVKYCFQSENKKINITLEKMLTCDLSKNRQTMMLALYDFDKNKCHLQNLTDSNLLERAKSGLDSLFTFGLTEYQKESSELLFKTMSCTSDINKTIYKFDEEVTQDETVAEKTRKSIQAHLIEKIKEINKLDVQLYDYAKEIFFKRLKLYNISIKN